MKVKQHGTQQITCPVDMIKVDENRVRVVAFFVLVLAAVFIIIQNPLIIALLLIDFSLRALNFNTYSPLAALAGLIVKRSGIKPKPVDRAPKRFAAMVGIVFIAAVLSLSLLHLELTAAIVAGVLIVFASLESFLSFCMGCYVYTFLIRVTGTK